MNDRPERHVPLLVVVPCRSGSKGIPRKGLRSVAGRPLILHTLETVKRSCVATRIVVSTDDPQIAGVARLHGYEVLDRPSELAQDDSTLAAVAKHAHETLDWQGDLLIAQPTCPLLKSETVIRFVSEFYATDHDWAIAGMVESHLMWQGGRCLTERANRQQLAEMGSAVRRESGALQIMTAAAARTWPVNPTVIDIPSDEALDIDTHADLAVAELALSRKTIEFRVVASDEKGSGHLYRCLALSDALNHHDVRWSQTGLEAWAVAILHSRGVRVSDFSQPDHVIPADLVIIDALDAAETVAPMAKARGSKVVVFEPEGADIRGVDLVFDEFTDSKYAVLRPEFLGLPRKRVPEQGTKVLVVFGGTDLAGLNGRVSSMLSFAVHADVRVIVGPGAKRPDGPVFKQRVTIVEKRQHGRRDAPAPPRRGVPRAPRGRAGPARHRHGQPAVGPTRLEAGNGVDGKPVSRWPRGGTDRASDRRTTERAAVMGVKLKVTNDQLHGKGTRVWLNDAEMTGSVVWMTLDWSCYDANKATISFLADEFDAETKALLTENTLRPTLRRPFRWLGWDFVRRVMFR